MASLRPHPLIRPAPPTHQSVTPPATLHLTPVLAPTLSSRPAFCHLPLRLHARPIFSTRTARQSPAVPSASAMPAPPAPVPEHLVQFAHRLADAAREVVPPFFRQPIGIELKADESPVTAADRAAEAAITALIRAEYPAHGILGEEQGLQGPVRAGDAGEGAAGGEGEGGWESECEWVWVIDPIDGTASFITGKPLFGTLVALLHRGRPVLGVLEQPVLRERWVGVAGRPTTFNGVPVATRRCADLRDAYVYTTSPDLFPGASGEAFRAVKSGARKANYGCDCYAFGLLSSGFVDVALEFGVKPWDYLALVPIVAGAGGRMTDWRGRELRLASLRAEDWVGDVVATGDAQLHATVLATLAWEQRGKGERGADIGAQYLEPPADRLASPFQNCPATASAMQPRALLPHSPRPSAFSPLTHPLLTRVSAAPRRISPRAQQSGPSDTPRADAPAPAQATMADGTEFVRAHLLRLKAYTPIVPFEVLSAQLGRAPEDIVKLDANENPYGPPPEVREALGSLSFPHVYPDPESRQLRAALAQECGVPMEHLLVGCGADELIDLIMRCVLEPGEAIVDCPPTFTMYAFDAHVNNARVITVPRRSDFSIDVAGVVAAVEAHRPKLLFLTSPNNPDGSMLSGEDLQQLLRLPVLVVLDEAYIEFSDRPSAMPLVQRHANLIVLRTFSKRAGLAGLRVGYGAFPLPLVEYLWRAKQPYNVSVAAEVAACAALSNQPYLQEVRDALVRERARLMDHLTALPFLKPFPSHANFILCALHNTHWTAKQLKEELAARGIMVRHYSQPDLCNYIRISVGKPEHTDALIRALSQLT
ncbi:unnamed protein product [Closterium sp. Naga37s-1]|nr:unnamed protein product [Closterium sp. Naga37s-1]